MGLLTLLMCIIELFIGSLEVFAVNASFLVDNVVIMVIKEVLYRKWPGNGVQNILHVMTKEKVLDSS